MTVLNESQQKAAREAAFWKWNREQDGPPGSPKSFEAGYAAGLAAARAQTEGVAATALEDARSWLTDGTEPTRLHRVCKVLLSEHARAESLSAQLAEARRATIEECAKVCDEQADYWSRRTSTSAASAEQMASNLADRIRQRHPNSPTEAK